MMMDGSGPEMENTDIKMTIRTPLIAVRKAPIDWKRRTRVGPSAQSPRQVYGVILMILLRLPPNQTLTAFYHASRFGTCWQNIICGANLILARSCRAPTLVTVMARGCCRRSSMAASWLDRKIWPSGRGKNSWLSEGRSQALAGL